MNRREFLKTIAAGAAITGPLGALANEHNESPPYDTLAIEMEFPTGMWFDPISVWATTDKAGANIVARASDDINGRATLHLPAGKYYIWRRKSGYSFDD